MRYIIAALILLVLFVAAPASPSADPSPETPPPTLPFVVTPAPGTPPPDIGDPPLKPLPAWVYLPAIRRP